MRAKLVWLAAFLGGCGNVQDPQPRLQTYGVIIPACLFFCTGTVTSGDLSDSATQTTTNNEAVGGL